MATLLRAERARRDRRRREGGGGGAVLLVGAAGLLGFGAWELLKPKSCPPGWALINGQCQPAPTPVPVPVPVPVPHPTPTPTPGAVCPPVGSLVRGTPSGALYIIVAGGKRQFASLAVVTDCHYNTNQIINVADTTLALCPSLPNVTGPPCPPGPMLQGCTYTVVSGDTLIGICDRAYGAFYFSNGGIIWEWVYNNNPQIKTIAESHGITSNWWHYIYPGEQIFLPVCGVGSGCGAPVC